MVTYVYVHNKGLDDGKGGRALSGHYLLLRQPYFLVNKVVPYEGFTRDTLTHFSDSYLCKLGKIFETSFLSC